MPKRRRLLYPSPQKNKNRKQNDGENKDGDMWTARGRLKGALMEALDPTIDDSDESSHYSPRKKERASIDEKNDENDYSSEEKDKKSNMSPPRQPYVLKLFDRSVDLSQFEEDSPLYPICRAWILNQPKANYRQLCKKKEESDEGFITLPGPEGAPVPRTPPLLPEQIAANKNSINLNYKENPPITREQLMAKHVQRWAAVRRAWRDQAALVEARYTTSHDAILNMKTS